LTRIELDHDYCKGCHLCIAVCPEKVWELSAERNAKGYLLPCPARPNDCSGCLLCEMTCPDLAIAVVHEKRHKGAAHAK
jgi:2-oxoglutarate ferredoxin oxidoreductase subunit delta